MKTKRKPTLERPRHSMPAPDATDREVGDFWDAHSVADYWDELEPVELRKRPLPRTVVTLRLAPQAVSALRSVARRRGVGFSILARTWLVERLKNELVSTARSKKGK